MNEVKTPKKPLVYYGLIVLAVLLLFNMLTVGAGQAVCAGGLGLVLVRTVEKSPLLKQWFEE